MCSAWRVITKNPNILFLDYYVYVMCIGMLLMVEPAIILNSINVITYYLYIT